MERRQLEYLVAVVDHGTFTRAAEVLHVAQPGLSTQIASLERELSHRLLDRGRRGVRPTPVGAQVLDRARAVLQAFDAVRAVADDAAGMLRGAVTVGTVRGVPLGDLASGLVGFRHDHPAVELRLVEAESAGLLDALHEGTVDLALVGLAGPAPAGIGTHTVLTDRLVVAVAAGDRWARRRRVLLAELADRPLVTFPPGTGNRQALDSACRAAGVVPQIAFEAGTLASIVELATAGLGAAVIPSAATGAGPAGSMTAITLAPAVRSRLALAWPDPRRRTPSPAAGALLDRLLADGGPAGDVRSAAGARRRRPPG